MGIFQTIVYYLSTMKDLLLTFLLIGAVAYASSESFQDETIAYEAASPVTFEEAADTLEDDQDSVSAVVDQVPDTTPNSYSDAITAAAVPVGKIISPKMTKRPQVQLVGMLPRSSRSCHQAAASITRRRRV